MYYTRPVRPAPPPIEGVKYDRRHALKDFDFTHLIDYRNVPVLRFAANKQFVRDDFSPDDNPLGLTGLSGDKALLDLAAAVVTQLHYRTHIKSIEIIREANEVFHQSLIEEGYSLCAVPDELRHSIKDPGIEIILPGAQTRSIWKERVDAAFRTLVDLPFPENEEIFVDVTFTGRCPEGGGKILNEAGDMLLYWEEKKRQLPKNITIRIHREDKARNTRENIENSFANRRPPRPEIVENSHFIFVSSLFHLPRLATEVTTVLDAHPGKVRQVTLVSAQKFLNEPEEPFHEASYMKSALFELFQALLSKRIREIPPKPGYGL